LQGQKNMTIIKKRIRFNKKKTKERWNCKKKKTIAKTIINKKVIVIKKIETKSDRWKYQLWMKLKTILNLINYSKLKKIATKRTRMKLKKPFNFIKYSKI
jgi:hypothetical protein